MKKSTLKILIILLISLLFIILVVILIKRSNYPQPTTDKSASHPKGAASISVTLTPTIIIEKAKVSFVFDGDTIELSDKRRVRYIGIDAPEINIKEKKPQCFATNSAKINKELVAGQEIEMAKDTSETDKYGRLLRYVYVEGVFINDFLLRQGFAKLDLVPPDLTYSEQFKEAQKEARDGKRGIWGRCYK